MRVSEVRLACTWENSFILATLAQQAPLNLDSVTVGVKVKQHICVVKYLPLKLILGHAWHNPRSLLNEDDGSYIVIIRSPDNMKEVKFLAMTLNVWSMDYCEMGEE